MNNPIKLHVDEDGNNTLLYVLDQNKESYLLHTYQPFQGKLMQNVELLPDINPLTKNEKIVLILNNYSFLLNTFLQYTPENFIIGKTSSPSFSDAKTEPTNASSLKDNSDDTYIETHITVPMYPPPFPVPESEDFSISKQPSGYAIADRENKKVTVYVKENCFDDYESTWSSTTIETSFVPQAAAFSSGLCRDVLFYRKDKGYLIVAYKNSTNMAIYTIGANWKTLLLYWVNKITGNIINIPWLLIFLLIGGKQ